MANASYKTYRLEYKCPINGQYHRVKNSSGDSKRFTGIKNARAGAYRYLDEHYSVRVVAIFGGRIMNPVAGVVKRENGQFIWYDYYHNNKKHVLNRDGSVRD